MKQRIGNNVRMLRERVGAASGRKLSQAELGFRAFGYDPKTDYMKAQQRIRKIEAGLVKTDYESLQKIAAALGVTVDDLLDGSTPSTATA